MKLQLVFLLCAVVLTATTAATIGTTGNCIVGCTCKSDQLERKLQVLGCENPITLTKSTFSKNSKLSMLHFENVNIESIDEYAFQGLKDLEEFSMKDCIVGGIHREAFDKIELNGIRFTRVKFVQVPELAGQFVEEIAFDDCHLTRIPNFEGLPNLAFINLNNNQIVNVSVNDFQTLEHLEELRLANNSIVKISANAFDKNSELNTLVLDENPLETFRISTEMNYLESISLRNCKISVFDRGSSKNLELVTFLDLSHNEIAILPLDAFNGMKELNYLYLSHNKLVELDDDIFLDNYQLERVILDHNNFKKLPAFQISEHTFVTTYFSCNHCGLKSVDNVFDNMNSLVTVNLNNNNITNIENAFRGLSDLKDLEIANNSLSSIGTNTFGKDSRIERLNLGGNPLKPLDPVLFSNFAELRKLDVSHANLSKIWSNHNSQLPKLERLLAGNNPIRSVQVEDLTILPKLKLIDLTTDNLKCTDLPEVIKYLIEQQIYPLEGATQLKTHENLISSDPASAPRSFDMTTAWESIECSGDRSIIKITKQTTSTKEVRYEIDGLTTSISLDSNNYNEDTDEDDDDESLEDDSDEYNYDGGVEVLEGKQNYDIDENIEVARASYILSITSVFALTALVVLSVAVAIILLVLRRNTGYMSNGNLPRLKIPKFHTPSLQKKHCGSVYKPLSEEHIATNYQFKPAPIHNNTIP